MAEVINIYEQESWNNAKKYKQAEVVLHVQTVYIALKDNTNITPGTDETAWMPLGDFVAGGGIVNLATNLVNGISKPDGKTIEIDANGTLTVKAIKTVVTLPSVQQANENTLYICEDITDNLYKLYKLINGVFVCLGGINGNGNVFSKTLDDFPSIGSEDKLYIDKANKSLYIYDQGLEEYFPITLKDDLVLDGGGA